MEGPAVTTPDTPLNVLFLCTGNSARSLIAEAVLAHAGAGRFRAFSAGSHPRGAPHPEALATLRRARYPTDGLRSKSWDEFATDDAPALDFVFTVCDAAAAETCPVWPGQPVTAHWGVPDPAAFQGTEAATAAVFNDTLRMLSNRVLLFLSLPLASLDRLSLQRRVSAIGAMARDPQATDAPAPAKAPGT
nr:arsenate reductase ArsC [Roseospira visakhapatnamensis]